MRNPFVPGALIMAMLAARPAASESFYLRAPQYNKTYGPFAYENGATVTVGKVVFEVVRKPAPPIAPTSANRTAEEAAARDVAPWLRQLDRDEFGGAWDGASDYLKLALQRDAFIESLKSVRQALGKTLSRKLASAQYATSMPSAPDGHYVVMQYAVALEHKQSAVETVIAALDSNGTWRVSGYFVR